MGNGHDVTNIDVYPDSAHVIIIIFSGTTTIYLELLCILAVGKLKGLHKVHNICFLAFTKQPITFSCNRLLKIYHFSDIKL